MPIGDDRHWRTWSQHRLEVGAYTVELYGPDGQRIAVRNFFVGRPSPPERDHPGESRAAERSPRVRRRGRAEDGVSSAPALLSTGLIVLLSAVACVGGLRQFDRRAAADS